MGRGPGWGGAQGEVDPRQRLGVPLSVTVCGGEGLQGHPSRKGRLNQLWSVRPPSSDKLPTSHHPQGPPSCTGRAWGPSEGLDHSALRCSRLRFGCVDFLPLGVHPQTPLFGAFSEIKSNIYFQLQAKDSVDSRRNTICWLSKCTFSDWRDGSGRVSGPLRPAASPQPGSTAWTSWPHTEFCFPAVPSWLRHDAKQKN